MDSRCLDLVPVCGVYGSVYWMEWTVRGIIIYIVGFMSSSPSLPPSSPFSLSFSWKPSSPINESLRGAFEGSLSLLLRLLLTHSVTLYCTLNPHPSTLNPHSSSSLISPSSRPLIPPSLPPSSSSPRSYLGPAPQSPIGPSIIKIVNLPQLTCDYCTVLYVLYCTSITHPPTAINYSRHTLLHFTVLYSTYLYVRLDTEPNHISRRHSID